MFPNSTNSNQITKIIQISQKRTEIAIDSRYEMLLKINISDISLGLSEI